MQKSSGAPDHSELRRKCRAARASLSVDERRSASLRIARKITATAVFRSGKRVATYLPMPEEVDTWPLIGRAWRMKKRVFVPVLESESGMRFRELSPNSDLATNAYGILEPRYGEYIRARELDVVLTPVVAFDDRRHRIGMGGGYYDRTFAFLRHRSKFLRPKLIGLAFACQQVEKITPNPWDIRLFRIYTESS